MVTDFGRWLGTGNGMAMLGALLPDATKEQAKAGITTYCMLFGVRPGTKEWDKLMRWTVDYYNCWFDTVTELDEYMRELFV